MFKPLYFIWSRLFKVQWAAAYVVVVSWVSRPAFVAAAFRCQQMESNILKEKGTYILGFIRISSRGCVACCVSLQLSLQCLPLSNVNFTKGLFPVLPRELGSFQPYVYLLQSCVYALASNLNLSSFFQILEQG